MQVGQIGRPKKKKASNSASLLGPLTAVAASSPRGHLQLRLRQAAYVSKLARSEHARRQQQPSAPPRLVLQRPTSGMGPQPFEHVDRQFLGGANERLHIRWKGFAANLIDSLENLHHTCTTDALLVAQKDGAHFKVHRVVLASASDILKSLLLDHEDNPVILIDDVDGHTIEDFISYLYKGQVTLNPVRLAAFVSFGKAIALKGIGDLQNASSSASGGQDPPLFTGLSLLASAAALNAGTGSSERKRRLSSVTFNDENDPRNGTQCAINLSIRGGNEASHIEEKCSKSPVTTTSTTATSFFPMTSLLNIPDPATFKWRRCSEHLQQPEDEREEETPPPLAIDMTVSEPVDLPATPSPSPSSLNGSGSTSYFMDTSPNGMLNGIGEPVPVTNGIRYLSTSDESGNAASRDQHGEGKKWKSRQPKLCVHCDRYFSNQFNLKQHILNMHTIGGDVRCDKCNKTVKNKWYLRRHQVTHHNAPLKK